jgi:hypothetical protein
MQETGFFNYALLIILLIIRIIGLVHCLKRAGRINASRFNWAIFALFFPIIAIIVINAFSDKTTIKNTRSLGRVISTVWAPFITLFGYFLIIMSQGPGKFDWDRDGFNVIIHIFLLVAVLVSWWSELNGGISLIAGVLSFIPFGLVIYPKASHEEMLPLLFFYSPFMISGIFYLSYWSKRIEKHDLEAT